MKPILNKRISPRAALAIAVVAAAASVFAARGSVDTVSPPQAVRTGHAHAASPGRPAAPAGLDLAKLHRPAGGNMIADLFPARDLTAPVSASPAQGPQAAAAPVAPALPFQYMGEIIDRGKRTLFVLRGEDHYSLVPGKKIDDQYKVERITDTAVTFTYLPLGVRQNLALPAVN